MVVVMFEVSTKVDYGLLIMLDLARVYTNQEYLALSEIANRHEISEKYLSQLIMPLKQAQLVISKEGKNGGYKLSKASQDITLLHIIEALDGPVQIVRCMDAVKDCPADHQCKVQPVWKQLNKDIIHLLQNKTLQDFL